MNKQTNDRGALFSFPNKSAMNKNQDKKHETENIIKKQQY